MRQGKNSLIVSTSITQTIRKKAYPHFTDRIIQASSGDCLEHTEVGTPTPDKIGDMSALKYTCTNRSTNSSGNISIPTSSLGREGTAYIYRGVDVPAVESTYSCSLRCIWMWAYRNPGAIEGAKFYQCPIEVSDVGNAGQLAHNVSDAVARVAAASIALQGRFQGPLWITQSLRSINSTQMGKWKCSKRCFLGIRLG